ncbi:MAG: hypothetical protein PUC26_05725 [Eubacteriales bacterium]|nr:hypothetical protein [Eubacteriales bacterium]
MIAFRCLYEFKLLPQEYLALDQESKVFLVAALTHKDDLDEEEAKELERQAEGR